MMDSASTTVVLIGILMLILSGGPPSVMLFAGIAVLYIGAFKSGYEVRANEDNRNA